MTGDKTPVEGNSGSETADAVPGAEPTDAPETVGVPEADAPVAADAVTLAPPAAATPALTPAPALGFEPTVPAPATDYSRAGVPSLDFVRDKIEGRYAKSLGATELAQETPEARSVEEEAAKRADAAKKKLDAIRRSLRGDSSS